MYLVFINARAVMHHLTVAKDRAVQPEILYPLWLALQNIVNDFPWFLIPKLTVALILKQEIAARILDYSANPLANRSD